MKSIIANGETYLVALNSILNNAATIRCPRALKDVVILQVNRRKGLVAWTIEDKEICFKNDSYLDCDETARRIGDTFSFNISRFSYHFRGNEELLDFRIDLKGGDLHANPDERAGLPAAHLRPGAGLALDIRDFNLFLAINIALWYLKNKQYPLDPTVADTLNKILGRLRRRLADD